MESINNIQILRNYIENKDFVIRNILESNASDTLYFTLIGSGQIFQCYTDIPEIIDYIYTFNLHAI